MQNKILKFNFRNNMKIYRISLLKISSQPSFSIATP